MKLALIKDEVCPECKSFVVAESCHSKHCNGQGFEVRQFACGCTLKWSPNFEKLEINVLCPNSIWEQDKNKKRKEAKEKLELFIKGLVVDDEWKKDIIYSIKYIH